MIVKALVAAAMSLALSAQPVSEPMVGADGYFPGYAVPQPPEEQRGQAIVGPVVFTDQQTIDSICGGTNQIIACAQIGGGWMALPNPCQPRFAGESYAALVCHEKGHTLGWRHG